MNGMATDIGSLAPGLDGHVSRSGIGRKGLRTRFSVVDSLTIVLLDSTIPLLTLLATATDTLGTADPLSSPSFPATLR
ncbi:hypothetical protein [Absidia glauca]|uniref:Uncharacterized protein n=1 Tax=Absidia glauca TaxID=4829 RepID=A0A168QSR9_ABSGL|nr:hypothetical protein [Absidia glauca]